jgi:hypothetical protein
MKKLLGVAALVVLLLSLPAAASAQATRTWVSGVGDDVNPCSRTAPCKTWAGAISKTATGGEMNALDPGGYGTLTITKSITVDGGGTFASTLNSGGINGFSINIPEGNAADPQRRVVLRNLEVNGAGTTLGLNGINLLSAADLRFENVSIYNQSGDGIDLTPSVTSPADISVLLNRVRIRDVGRNGIEVRAPDPAHKIDLMVTDSEITGVTGTTPGTPTATDTGIGLFADSGATAWLGGSTIFDNAVGLRTANAIAGGTPGVITDFCDNHLGGNDVDGAATTKACPQPPATVTNTNTVTAPAPPPQVVTVTQTVTVPAKTTPVPARCVVPTLKGLTKAAAAKKLKAAKCALGTVTLKRTTNRKLVGKVTAQKVLAGKSLVAGSRIAVTVGR